MAESDNFQETDKNPLEDMEKDDIIAEMMSETFPTGTSGNKPEDEALGNPSSASAVRDLVDGTIEETLRTVGQRINGTKGKGGNSSQDLGDVSKIYRKAFTDPKNTALEPLRTKWSPSSRFIFDDGILARLSYESAQKTVAYENMITGTMVGLIYHAIGHPNSITKKRIQMYDATGFRLLDEELFRERRSDTNHDIDASITDLVAMGYPLNEDFASQVGFENRDLPAYDRLVLLLRPHATKFNPFPGSIEDRLQKAEDAVEKFKGAISILKEDKADGATAKAELFNIFYGMLTKTPEKSDDSENPRSILANRFANEFWKHRSEIIETAQQRADHYRMTLDEFIGRHEAELFYQMVDLDIFNAGTNLYGLCSIFMAKEMGNFFGNPRDRRADLNNAFEIFLKGVSRKKNGKYSEGFYSGLFKRFFGENPNKGKELELLKAHSLLDGIEYKPGDKVFIHPEIGESGYLTVPDNWVVQDRKFVKEQIRQRMLAGLENPSESDLSDGLKSLIESYGFEPFAALIGLGGLYKDISKINASMVDVKVSKVHGRTVFTKAEGAGDKAVFHMDPIVISDDRELYRLNPETNRFERILLPGEELMPMQFWRGLLELYYEHGITAHSLNPAGRENFVKLEYLVTGLPHSQRAERIPDKEYDIDGLIKYVGRAALGRMGRLNGNDFRKALSILMRHGELDFLFELNGGASKSFSVNGVEEHTILQHDINLDSITGTLYGNPWPGQEGKNELIKKFEADGEYIRRRSENFDGLKMAVGETKSRLNPTSIIQSALLAYCKLAIEERSEAIKTNHDWTNPYKDAMQALEALLEIHYKALNKEYKSLQLWNVTPYKAARAEPIHKKAQTTSYSAREDTRTTAPGYKEQRKPDYGAQASEESAKPSYKYESPADRQRTLDRIRQEAHNKLQSQATRMDDKRESLASYNRQDYLANARERARDKIIQEPQSVDRLVGVRERAFERFRAKYFGPKK